MAARGQLDSAIAEFREALALDPDSADTHWHLGAALAEAGALKEAEEHLRTSVQRDPNNVEAKHDLETVGALLRQR
jgi:Flp pilus assembly protein TadD